MKKVFNLILWTALISSIGVEVKAQDNSTCFMLDSDGNQINLGYLCQNYSSQPRHSDYQNSQRYKENYYQNPQQYRQPKGFYSVPIKSRRGGIPVIDVKFNNRYIFEMMLDTGASEIVITEQMAKVLKVNHTEKVWVSTPSNPRVIMPAGYLYSVGVADISQRNPFVITSPSMDMGLLGQSFFSRYDMTIKSNVVEFRER